MYLDNSNNKITLSPQHFSTTDLKKTGDIGIVFPLKKANNNFNFASIVDIKDDRCLLKRTETRIASSTQDEIVYAKGYTASYIFSPKKIIHPSSIEYAFIPGITPKEVDNSYMFLDSMESISNKAWDIFEYLSTIDFNPEVIISSENLSKKESKSYFDYYKPTQKKISLDDIYDYKRIEEYLKGYDFPYTFNTVPQLASKSNAFQQNYIRALIDIVDPGQNVYDKETIKDDTFYEWLLEDISTLLDQIDSLPLSEYEFTNLAKRDRIDLIKDYVDIDMNYYALTDDELYTMYKEVSSDSYI